MTPTDEELQERFRREYLGEEGERVAHAQRTVWEELYRLWRQQEIARELVRDMRDCFEMQRYDNDVDRRSRRFLGMEEI